MITIDLEAKRLAKIPLSVGRMGERYITSNGIYSFPSPSLETLEKNLFYLLRNSEEKLFQQKYKYRPSYLSNDEYGTIVLGYLLMYVNNVHCIEDFELNMVYIPSYRSIIEISMDIFEEKEESDLTSILW